jgi:trimeric autotransporter adhesin
MSTKTTFKRIALVAVAALGLGVLSVAPSQAAAGVPTLTTTTGSASVTAGQQNETTTAATVSVVGLLTAGSDSYSVQILRKSAPSTGGSVAFRVAYMETSTASTTRVGHTTNDSTNYALLGANRSTVTAYDSVTATSAGSYWLDSQGAGYVGAKFGLMVDSATTRVAGTYVYTAIVTPYSNGTGGTPVTADLTFTINDTAANVAAESGTIAPALTTAYLNAGSSVTTASDSAVAVVSTASTTDHAAIQVKTYTVDSLAAPESVTVTVTGPGLVCYTKSAVTTCGKSIVATGLGNTTAGVENFTVRADGTAGTSNIVVKTTTVTFPAKTVTFFAKAAKTITTSVNKPAIGIGTTSDVVRATITDADGTVWGGAAYIYAATAAFAAISGSATTPVACTFVPALGYHACPTTSTAVGTSHLKVIDAATVALSNVASAETPVKVTAGTASTVKIAFDKATYAPGEKAVVSVTVLDAAGGILPATGTSTTTIANVFTSTGIVSSVALTGAALTSTDVVIAPSSSSTSGTTAGSQNYVVYMPMASGDVTLTATGSTGLATAGRVAVSATASVVNSSVDAATDAANEATDAANAATDAALAAADAADAATAAAQDASDAVAALSASVSKLISSLRAQITSLTNLVIKIQKKVRA